ncbi:MULTISPECIES: plasmid stabilization protein [Nocardia]|uniref:Plasmid stabilization protein n=1 Tax=Nocardia coubleae TaxID=356147 RepID=A0A846WCU0_9NOCA|nr:MULTISPECIES: plasmid stabilization protein [Nocardia]MCA2209056.1 plasmid stabilization protein [Nocardia rosealba]NKX90128.1 plasmid stabilization protein [Nocardia coubleae]
MPQQAWSDKRERQYKDIKKSERERGRSEDRAEEIAARTVNKTRAQHGETKSGGSSSGGKSGGKSSGTSRRGGQQAKGSGKTRDELYEEARRRNIDGRSKMNKQELANALGRH